MINVTQSRSKPVYEFLLSKFWINSHRLHQDGFQYKRTTNLYIVSKFKSYAYIKSCLAYISQQNQTESEQWLVLKQFRKNFKQYEIKNSVKIAGNQGTKFFITESVK